MPEPTTPNTALIIPNTGDLVGSWGSTALNPDFVAIDGMFGGVVTIALSNSSFPLGLPSSGTISPTSGPNQSQNAMIKFTGTLTANITVTLGMPGRYTFWNTCLPITHYVQIASSGSGTTIGLPPGKKCTVFHDGVNCDFVDMPDVGTAYDLHGVTALPAWMTACSVAPYLIKDGSIYNMATYPVLGAQLGSAFGGDGVTTFGVPDELARMRVPYDTKSTGRMTSPVNASSMGSNGGEQAHTLITAELAAHNHTLTDPSHEHSPGSGSAFAVQGGSAIAAFGSGALGTASQTAPATTGITIASAGGGGAHNNVQPGIVSFLALIKT